MSKVDSVTTLFTATRLAPPSTSIETSITTPFHSLPPQSSPPNYTISTPCHQPPQQPPPTAAKPAFAANTSTANPSPPPPPPTTPPNDAYAKLSPKAKPSPPSYAPLMINSRVRLMQRTPRRSRIRAMWMMSTVMLVGVIRGFV